MSTLNSLLSCTCPGPPLPVRRSHAEHTIQAWCQGTLPKNHLLQVWEGCCFSREFISPYLCSGILCDPGKLWVEVTGAKGVMNLWQGKCARQNVAPGDIKHHGYWPLLGVLTFCPGLPLQPSCWQPGVFDEAKACEPKLDLGTWSHQQRASRKCWEASTTKLYG